MRMKVYTIYDKKSQVYTPPMVFHNDGHATRELQMQLRGNAKAVMSQYPADYDLLCICEWDDTSGQIGTCARRIVLSLDALVQVSSE